MNKQKFIAIVFFKDNRVIKYQNYLYKSDKASRKCNIQRFENYVSKCGGGAINYYDKATNKFIEQVKVN